MFVTAPELSAENISTFQPVQASQESLVKVVLEGSTKASRCAMIVLSGLEIVLSLTAAVGSIVMAVAVGGVGSAIVAACVALVCAVTLVGSLALLFASMKAVRQSQTATTAEVQIPQSTEVDLVEADGVANV